jgi:hypothetical protein
MTASFASYGAKGGDSDGGFVYGGSQPGSQGGQGGQKVPAFPSISFHEHSAAPQKKMKMKMKTYC